MVLYNRVFFVYCFRAKFNHVKTSEPSDLEVSAHHPPKPSAIVPHLRAQVSAARLPAPTSPRRQSTPYCVKPYGHWKHSPIRNYDHQLTHKDGGRHRQDRLPDFPSRTTKDLMDETQFEDRRHHSSIPFTNDNKPGWLRRDPTTHLEVVGRDGGGHRLREHPHDVRSLRGKHGHQSHENEQNGQPGTSDAARRGSTCAR